MGQLGRMGTVRPMEEHRQQVVGTEEVEMGMVVVEMVEEEMGMAPQLEVAGMPGRVSVKRGFFFKKTIVSSINVRAYETYIISRARCVNASAE